MGAPLIFLPGALDDLEGAGVVASRLSDSRPLVRIAYRSDDGIEPLLNRVAAAAAGRRCDILGQSYGGWIAQCFARRHPDLTRRLVLSHSFVLRPSDRWRFRLGSRLLKSLPDALMRPVLLKRVRGALAPLAAADPALVARQLERLARDIAGPEFRGKLLAQQRCMRESLEPAFASLPPVSRNVPVLIIESDNDPLIRPRDRARLRAFYPEAALRCFEGAGHISAMTCTETYIEAVRCFLDG